MSKDTITNLIADIRNWEKNAKKNSAEPKLAEVASALVPVLDSIATRLECLVKDGLYVTPNDIIMEAQCPTNAPKIDKVMMNPPFACKLKMPVISMPGKAAIKYHVDDPELPRLAAHIESIKYDDGKTAQECTVYIGNEVLSDMYVFRGKTCAIKMVRQAMKGVMSHFGKHRRMTANRQAREAAKKEGK